MTLRMIASDRLRTFAAFADDPNLSRTARRLGLSQPAVHAQLKALAEEVGVVLYHRVGRGLALTEEGTAVAGFARDIAERTTTLIAQLRGEADESPIVLAAGAGALVHLLAPGLRAFSRSRARRIEVVTADATSAVELVRQGRAHVGVAAFGVPPSDLDVHPIVRASQVLVVPRAHRLAGRRSVALGDLSAEPLIMPPEGGAQRAALDAAFAADGVPVRIAAVARGWDVVLRLVELGIGVGIVNDTCVLPRTLVSRPLRGLPPVSYVAFTRRGPRVEISDLVRAFAEHSR